MITGEIKNRIDSIWDAFWTGGITNSMDILAQMTYLFFMKMLDDAQMTKEANANAFGVAVKDPTFKEGLWHNPDTDKDIPYNALRWHIFKNTEAEESRSRKEQSFIVPVEEIRNNDYDLSINKYKEVEKVKVEYEDPSVVLGRIEGLQSEINAAFKEFREKYL